MVLGVTYPNEIGPRLARIRKNKGYSLRKLSSITGLHLATISKVETGHNLPTIGTLDIWCKALGVTEITIRFGGSPE